MIIRYDFSQDKTNGKPQILYFIKDECKYEYDKKKSFTHNIAEFCYVVSGEGHFHVERDDFLLSANDAYIVNPYLSHGEYVEKGQEFSYYIIGIANFSLSADIHSEKPKKLPKDNRIAMILDYCFHELYLKNEGYEVVFDNLFKILLVEIRRLYKAEIGQSNPLQETIATRIKNYIDVNYLGDCSSKTIADFFDKKLNTIEIKFKKQFGMSMQQYILHLRIEMAKKHLESNNMSIRELAITCGFYNPSYFTQYFKKTVGITPTEYKKSILSQN